MTPAASDLVTDFARNLRHLRRERGWSQEELALKAGIDRTYVSGCERGVRNPSLQMIERLALALEVPADELLRGQQ